MTRRLRTNRVPTLLVALALAILAAVSISACGWSSDSKSVAEGQPVELGDLKYNVVFSRFLNPNDNEDSAYLVGQPEASPGNSWFGVFLEVQNETDEPQRVGSMHINDAEGREYAAFPSESLYALKFGEEVEPEEQIPILDSTPQQGPIEGVVLLFRLPASASENRPLTMTIASGGEEGLVTLDL